MALERGGERVECADAVAGGGGEVGADRAEFLGAAMERMQPEILIRSLLMRIACSAALFVNGTRRSRANPR